MKKTLAMLVILSLALAMPSALAANADRSLPLYVNNSCILVTEEGEALIEPETYSMIYSISEEGTPAESELFCAMPYARYENDEYDSSVMLLDYKGNALTDAKYDYIIAEAGNITFCIDGMLGVMDGALNVIYDAVYSSLQPNGEGGYIALRTDPYDDTPDGLYLLDGAGGETATGIKVLYGLSPYSEGMSPASSSDGARMGYLGTNGEWKLQPQYAYAIDFVGGVAVAAVDSGAGVINTSGEWVVTPKYEYIEFSESGNFAVANLNYSSVALIDTKTFDIIAEFEGDEAYGTAYGINDACIITLDGIGTLYDATGKKLIESEGGVYSAYDGGDDRIIVQLGEWGGESMWLYDLEGNPVAGPYQDLALLDDIDGETYYTFATFDVEDIEEDDEDWLGIIEVDGTRRIGVVNSNGDMVLPAEYIDIMSLCDGRLSATTDTQTGMIDITGKWYVSYPYNPEVYSEIEE